MRVEISELNGRVGNKDHFLKSRWAEQEVLTCVSRLIQRPILANTQSGAQNHDFTTAQGHTGDIKIYSRSDMSVELEQHFLSGTKPGWFKTYLGDQRFVGMFVINSWQSEFHGCEVFKLRWIPWSSLINHVIMHPEREKNNSRGSYMMVDPTQVNHIYLGDFFSCVSAHGAPHKAFDTTMFYANNKLNIPALHVWF